MAQSQQEAQAAGLGWVPESHPLYGTKGYVGYTDPAASGTKEPGKTVNSAAGTTTADQAKAASTFSATPGAAPTEATANQGTQDVVRNEWLAQATQGTAVDRTDPNFKQQLDPFVAQQDRARRQYESEQAERLSAQRLGNSGAMDQERRYAAEKSGQAAGAFESQLVTRELENRREEIQAALQGLTGIISDDQRRALQKQLAELDAAVRREGVGAQTGLGYAELGVKDRLGTSALNVDMIRAMLQNQQFNDGQSLDWSRFDWDTNPMNPRNF